MQHVDGFVLPVPKSERELYRRLAQKSGRIRREHGDRESVAENVKVGQRRFFQRSVELECVVD